MSFSDKLQEAKNLLSEGKYGDFISFLFKKFLSVFFNNVSKMEWSVKYLYLRKNITLSSLNMFHRNQV